MTAYHLFEWLIVGAAVGGSGWQIGKRFLPGRRAAASKSGCGACDSCGACASPPPSTPGEQPVRFHRD